MLVLDLLSDCSLCNQANQFLHQWSKAPVSAAVVLHPLERSRYFEYEEFKMEKRKHRIKGAEELLFPSPLVICSIFFFPQKK